MCDQALAVCIQTVFFFGLQGVKHLPFGTMG
nr:MAG TPA: hypothetical protein [Caudoviricetes sp.]